MSHMLCEAPGALGKNHRVQEGKGRGPRVGRHAGRVYRKWKGLPRASGHLGCSPRSTRSRWWVGAQGPPTSEASRTCLFFLGGYHAETLSGKISSSSAPHGDSDS